MGAITRDESTSAAGATKVWDLADASLHRGARRHGFDLGGPIAAALGGVALGAAVAPGVNIDARWCLVAGAGVVALLVAFSAIRRRQALVSLLLALTGLLSPLAAGAVAVDTTMAAKPAVTSAVVSDASLTAVDDALVTTRAFTAMSRERRADAAAFATSLVLRLRTLHGSSGPYPTSLDLSDGSVVEGAGLLQGTALGVVPTDARLDYRVTTSGSAFQVVVVSDDDPRATVTANSSLVVPGAD